MLADIAARGGLCIRHYFTAYETQCGALHLLICVKDVCMAVEEQQYEAKSHGEPFHGLCSTCNMTSQSDLSRSRAVAWVAMSVS